MADENANGQVNRRVSNAILGMKMDRLIEQIDDVKSTLKDHCKADETWRASHNRETSTMKSEIAVLKVKAGVWGMAGGAIPLVIMLLIDMMKDRSWLP